MTLHKGRHCYTRCKTPPLEASAITDLRRAEREKRGVQSYCLQLAGPAEVWKNKCSITSRGPGEIPEELKKELVWSHLQFSRGQRAGVKQGERIAFFNTSNIKEPGNLGSRQHRPRYLTPFSAWERPFHYSEQLHLISSHTTWNGLVLTVDQRGCSAAFFTPTNCTQNKMTNSL